MAFVIDDGPKKIVTIKGVDYEMVQPTVEHAEMIEGLGQSDDKTNSQKIHDACKFLEVLGLPIEISKGLTLVSITQLIRFINDEIDENGKLVNVKKN